MPFAHWPAMRIALLCFAILSLSGCVTESDHVHAVTLPSGEAGYVVTCNSNRYDRCLSRAARVCNGAYAVVPDERTTVRFGDPMPVVGNGEQLTVRCGG